MMRPVSSRYSPTFRRFFDPCVHRLYRKWLHQILIDANLDEIPSDVPLLLVANHVSWWDGFILWDLQRILRPCGIVRTVMLDSEMRKHWIFRWMGGIPITPGEPGSIRYAFRLAKEQRTKFGSRFCAVYLPQGKIWPSTKRPLGFHRGIERFAKELSPIAVLPIGIHLEPLNHQKPSLFLSVGKAIPSDKVEAGHLERLVEAQLDSILDNLSNYGEMTPHRPLFVNMLTTP